MKRRLFSFSITLLLLLTILPTSVLADLTAEPDKIRVGFFALDGYHMIDQDGCRSGYGYDLLQLMARYGDFEYEYIGYEKTFEEMTEMLENGEIDLLTCAIRSPETEDRFEFSERSPGRFSSNLIVRSTGEYISPWDNSSHDGMMVGMLCDTYCTNVFEAYAENSNITFRPVFFNQTDSMLIALHNNKVDAIVSSSLRAISAGEHIVERFAESPFYIAAAKGNTALMEQVNYALTQMDLYETNWRMRLDETYYQNNYTHLHLDAMEYGYLQNLQSAEQPLKVLMNPDRFPYSYFEDGQAKGILVDYFKVTAQQVNLPYEFIYIKSLEHYMEIIRSGQADIYLGVPYDLSLAENRGYEITDPYMSSKLSFLMRKDFSGAIQRAAVLKNSSSGRINYETLPPNTIYLTYDSHAECLEALRKKQVDIYCTYDYSAEYAILQDESGILISKAAPVSIDFSLGVPRKHDFMLITLLNKALMNINQTTENDIIFSNTNWDAPPLTFSRFFFQYPNVAFAVFSGGLLLVFTLIFILFQYKHQKKLELTMKQAVAANQSKSAFLSQMSHDIRTPINGLTGMIELARRNINDPKKISDYLQKMQNTSNHLTLLVNDVLDMSKMDHEGIKTKIDASPFHLPTLLDECISIVDGRLIGRDLEFITNIANMDHPDLIGSKTHLSRVLINILGNAIKYTKDEGTIRFHVHESSHTTENATFVFSIQDTGIGMSDEFQKHLFDAFAQEDREETRLQGTGLGMTIAKQLINRMNGTLVVDSKIGIGSTFTLTLTLPIAPTTASSQDPQPLSLASMPPVTASPAPTVPAKNRTQQKPFHIMVVEDVELNQEYVMCILEDEGYQVTIAENGARAVELFRSSPPGTYDLIFMDIRMPVMNGYQATEAIRKMSDRPDGSSIPIVAMSANAYIEDIEQSKASGMNDHLRKPIKAIEILSAVESYKASAMS